MTDDNDRPTPRQRERGAYIDDPGIPTSYLGARFPMPQTDIVVAYLHATMHFRSRIEANRAPPKQAEATADIDVNVSDSEGSTSGLPPLSGDTDEEEEEGDEHNFVPPSRNKPCVERPTQAEQERPK